MPSVGLRRTTRVFGVIKGVDGARVLRSGRRLWQESGDGKLRRSNDGDEWYHTIIKNDNYQTKNQNKNSDLKYKENSGWAHDDKLKKDLGVVIAIAAPKRIKRVKSEKKFGIVYRRKRKRLGGEKSEDSEDKKFGIQFSRRQRRSLDDESSESLVCTPELVVLVEDFSSSSSNGLSCFLSSVLRYIKRVNLSLSELADFLLSEPISSVFASNGLHFARVSVGSFYIMAVFCRSCIVVSFYIYAGECWFFLYNGCLLCGYVHHLKEKVSILSAHFIRLNISDF